MAEEEANMLLEISLLTCTEYTQISQISALNPLVR